MNDRLEDRLGSSLRQHAEQTTSTADLASAAIGRAQRIRTRRRAATAIASLVVVASALPVGLNLVGGGNDRTEPINTPTPEPTVVETAEPPRPSPEDVPSPQGPIELDFGELPSGPAPGVPYVDVRAGEIVDGDVRVPFAETEIDSVRKVTGGYLVNVYGGEDPGLFLIGDDGSSQHLSTSSGYVASSTDGGRSIAWSEIADNGGSSTLVLADGNGAERHSLPLDYSADVWGFLRGRVLVQPTDERALQLWNPETGTLADFPGAVGGLTTDGADLAAIITEVRGIEERPCTSVVDVSAGNRELWSSCEQRVETISPDGRYVSTIDAQTDGLGPPEIRVAELATGREIMTLRADLFQRTSWDANGNLLAEVVKDNRQAIVRCDLGGNCELATEPAPYDLEAMTDPRPYVLNQR